MEKNQTAISSVIDQFKAKYLTSTENTENLSEKTTELMKVSSQSTKLLKQVKAYKDYDKLTSLDFENFQKKMAMTFGNTDFLKQNSRLYELLKFIFGICLEEDWSEKEFEKTLKAFMKNFEYPPEYFKPASFFKYKPKIEQKFEVKYKEIAMPERYFKGSLLTEG